MQEEIYNEESLSYTSSSDIDLSENESKPEIVKNEIVEQEEEFVDFLNQTNNSCNNKQETNIKKENEDIFFSLEIEPNNEISKDDILKKKDKIIEKEENFIEKNHSINNSEINYFRNTKEDQGSNIYKIDFNNNLIEKTEDLENKFINKKIIQEKKKVIHSENEITEKKIEINLDTNLLNQNKILTKSKKKKDLTIKFFVKEKSFSQIFYFLIKGEIYINKKKKTIDVIRRYKDFDFLNTLINEKIFYRVLPLIPEKDLLLKITKNKNLLEKRTKGLERFLNKLLLIEEIKNFEPFKLFLLNQEKFQIIYNDLEFSNLYEKNGILNNFGDKFNSLYNFIKNKGSVNFDTGYYSDFSKKIESMFFFLKNFLLNLQNIKNESIILFQEARNCESFLEDNKKNVFIDEFYDLNSKEKKLKNFFYILENILEDINACRKSLTRKNFIYKKFYYCQQNLKNMNEDDNKRFLIKKEFDDLKNKIDKMNELLKNDLELKIYLINQQIEKVFELELKKSFNNLFKN